jgi:hypothetical protein
LPLAATDLETTHLFGFTLGSDTNAAGEKEAESETTGRFGKSSGSYAAVSSSLGVKFAPLDNFTVEPGVSLSRYDANSSGQPFAPAQVIAAKDTIAMTDAQVSPWHRRWISATSSPSDLGTVHASNRHATPTWLSLSDLGIRQSACLMTLSGNLPTALLPACHLLKSRSGDRRPISTLGYAIALSFWRSTGAPARRLMPWRGEASSFMPPCPTRSPVIGPTTRCGQNQDDE